MSLLEKLKQEWDEINKDIDDLEKKRSEKIKEYNNEKDNIRKNLPDLFGIVLKTNIVNGVTLKAGSVYALDYNNDLEIVFKTHQRNYSDSDDVYDHCPTCCKMKIHTWEELNEKQKGNVIYATYR